VSWDDVATRVDCAVTILLTRVQVNLTVVQVSWDDVTTRVDCAVTILLTRVQVNLTVVQVSWEDVATRVDCADQFLVKSGQSFSYLTYFQFEKVLTDFLLLLMSGSYAPSFLQPLNSLIRRVDFTSKVIEIVSGGDTMPLPPPPPHRLYTEAVLLVFFTMATSQCLKSSSLSFTA
jgi:hypothetical protein